ncbi:unnamed protein product [Lymnaea stagnalis]|uniref:Golgin-45 n=1 Tax=Lymnaea stagnalis TaxID=6523 RepID=A0AAV2IF71_LYMST
MSTYTKQENGTKETVLLRQALPKYNFQQARKLPKETMVDGSHSENPIREDNLLQTQTTFGINSELLKPSSSRPVAVVGASHHIRPQPDTVNDKLLTGQPNLPVLPMPVSQTYNSASLRQALIPQSKEHPTAENPHHRTTVTGDVDTTTTFKPQMTIRQSVDLLQSENLSSSPVIAAHCGSNNSSIQNSTSVTMVSSDTLSSDNITRLEHEKDELKKELKIQLQVNSELKRLLVASVGEDLSQRVERLCRDRAQLSMDIGGFSKKLNEDYENLDKVSIQADMWRSKYLASRVMIEELGNARAYYSLQCHEAQNALQQLLNERHELRTNLLEAYKVLQQVKSAFDPLNSQCSSSLRSTNVLELSRSCQQLAEAMRFRLLPAHVAVNIDADVTDELWSHSVTRAEQFAHEVLSRPVEPTGSLQSGSSRLIPVTGPHDSLIKRFHPHTRHENLTLNCCEKCQGEISVI